ncbi:hypothetical protein Z043_105691, partial [Scleropages formosus]
HTEGTTRSYRYILHSICRICPYLTNDSAQLFVQTMHRLPIAAWIKFKTGYNLQKYKWNCYRYQRNLITRYTSTRLLYSSTSGLLAVPCIRGPKSKA